MSKPIIAVDADDTIFDENTAVRLYMNDHYGFKHTEADYLIEGPFDSYWARIWNVDPEKMTRMYEEFAHSTYKKDLKPITGAIPILQKLKDKYDLAIVTSRGQSVVGMTHESLRLHYPDIFSDVHFVPLWGNGEKTTKAVICNEIGASYLIDDSFEHCKLAAEAGVNAITFGDYGWNRFQELPDRITRCKNWEEVWRILG
jgi:uncharacterized HAD superfamily protein